MTPPDAPDAPPEDDGEIPEVPWRPQGSVSFVAKKAEWPKPEPFEEEPVTDASDAPRDLLDENRRLRQFFEKCWDHARDGTDVEGFDVQEWGEQLGLLKPVEATAPCSEGCYCAEYYGEFPATCYRLVWGASRPGEPE